MDNLACHKTEKLIEFYAKNIINVLFNLPYFSDFNSIELGFRNLKRYLYHQIFSSTEETENEIRKYINDNRFNDGIRNNF